jgi:predicted DNA-binding transcriptional regulator AlpA
MNTAQTIVSDERTAPLLSTDDVAEWLGVKVSTLHHWRHTHRGPRSLTVGGRVRYRVSDIEEWLDSGARRGAR